MQIYRSVNVSGWCVHIFVPIFSLICGLQYIPCIWRSVRYQGMQWTHVIIFYLHANGYSMFTTLVCVSRFRYTTCTKSHFFYNTYCYNLNDSTNQAALRFESEIWLHFHLLLRQIFSFPPQNLLICSQCLSYFLASTIKLPSLSSKIFPQKISPPFQIRFSLKIIRKLVIKSHHVYNHLPSKFVDIY